jgi:hypothetical protein
MRKLSPVEASLPSPSNAKRPLKLNALLRLTAYLDDRHFALTDVALLLITLTLTDCIRFDQVDRSNETFQVFEYKF